MAQMRQMRLVLVIEAGCGANGCALRIRLRAGDEEETGVRIGEIECDVDELALPARVCVEAALKH